MAAEAAPHVGLSTSSAFLWQESTEPPSDVKQWQPARVILAEITKEVYGLVVCPVLDCGLAAHPVVPTCEMLIPESGSSFTLVEPQKHVVVSRVDQSTGAKRIFYLSFMDMLEFWDFGLTVAQLRSDEEIRKADLAYKLGLVRLFVPSHGDEGLMDALCANADHAPGGDQSPSSTSSAITVTGE